MGSTSVYDAIKNLWYMLCIQWIEDIKVNWQKRTLLKINNLCSVNWKIPWFTKIKEKKIWDSTVTYYVSSSSNWLPLTTLVYWWIKTFLDNVALITSIMLSLLMLWIILLMPAKSWKEVSERQIIDRDSDDDWDDDDWKDWDDFGSTKKDWNAFEKYKFVSQKSLLWFIWELTSDSWQEQNKTSKNIYLWTLWIIVLLLIWIWIALNHSIKSILIDTWWYISSSFDLLIVLLWFFSITWIQIAVIYWFLIKFYLDKLITSYLKHEDVWIFFIMKNIGILFIAGFLYYIAVSAILYVVTFFINL